VTIGCCIRISWGCVGESFPPRDTEAAPKTRKERDFNARDAFP
jgi:hypothetical protein